MNDMKWAASARMMGLLASLVLAAPASNAAPAPSAKPTGKTAVSPPVSTRTIKIEQGDQFTFQVNGNIERVATANGKIVGINAIPPSGVVLTAAGAGMAMVSVWVEGRSIPVAQYRVNVTPRYAANREGLGQNKDRLQVEPVGTALRLSGQLSSLESHSTALEGLAATSTNPTSDNPGGLFAMLFGTGDDTKKTNVIDNTVTNFDVQVQLNVKVVEVSRSKLKSSGFSYNNYGNGANRYLQGPNGLTGFVYNAAAGETLAQTGTGFVPTPNAFNLARWGANSLTVFSALENNGFAYTLAEPTLTAISGQPATFLAGGELPIPVRTSGTSGALAIEYKRFGIQLRMVPTVLDKQRINIELSPEVSEIDEGVSINVGGLVIPGLRVRRTETTVSLSEGETFVISGLVTQQSTSNIDKFPILGDIPILGAFFKSNRFGRDDRELLMLITPYLVRPFNKDAKLPALPGAEIKDYDPGYLRMLFLENGKFEQAESGFSR